MVKWHIYVDAWYIGKLIQTSQPNITDTIRRCFSLEICFVGFFMFGKIRLVTFLSIELPFVSCLVLASSLACPECFQLGYSTEITAVSSISKPIRPIRPSELQSNCQTSAIFCQCFMEKIQFPRHRKTLLL